MWEKIKLITSAITGDVWDFIKPLLKLYLTKAGKILAIAAKDAVKAIAESYGDSDGSTKREAAFELIVENLKNQGIELGTAFINAAIETAVVKYKEETEAAK